MSNTETSTRFLDLIPQAFAREHLVLGEGADAEDGGTGKKTATMRLIHAGVPRTEPLVLHNVRVHLGEAWRSATEQVEPPETLARRIDEAYAAREQVALATSLAGRADREDVPTIELHANGGAGDHASTDEELTRLDAITGERDLLTLADKAPVVRLTDAILFDAIGRQASDIHIQPLADCTLVRFRVDGVLLTARRLGPRLAPAIVSRIKVMSRLDVAERRAAQDGRATVTIGSGSATPGSGLASSPRAIDLRIATLPSAYGERLVIRLLDTQQGRALASLDALGMPPAVEPVYCDRAGRSSGIVLVTGPTGSGKTTTLYATLRWIATRHGHSPRGRTDGGTPLNILTIEDPIEYDLSSLNQSRVASAESHGKASASLLATRDSILATSHSLPVSQTQVDPRKGLTFATGLRHILRQDPDVIMVGEIRDLETARTAIQASLTGHLVFSTLHTADAPGAITRLFDLGIEPYLVASSLSCVLAQRLVRLTHQPCGGAGCAECLHSGFKGRRGIFELLAVDGVIRDLISKGEHGGGGAALRDAAVARGMQRLEDQGASLAKAGLTTIDEVRRVTLGAEG